MTRTPKRSILSNTLAARFPVTLTAADLLASLGAAEDDLLKPVRWTGEHCGERWVALIEMRVPRAHA